MYIQVELSQQDLSDFLEDSADYMEQYRAELERRLSEYGDADVSVSHNALDKITIEPEEAEPWPGFVNDIMARMANEMEVWLNA